MKKITLTLFTALTSLVSLSQVSTIVDVPNPNTAPGTTGLRAPNGTSSHTVMRGQYFISQSDLAAVSPTITSFGFSLANGVNTAASGTLTVYLQHTPATSYTSGTTWSTAGMTTIYSGSYSIPVGTTPVNIDLPLGSAFNYTGGALNIAYEYTAGVVSSSVAIYNAFAGTALGATGSSTSTAITPTLGSTGFRPVFRFGTPNTITNDISVDYVSVSGFVPANTFSSQSIRALISNKSNTVLTNVAVGYSLTGLSTGSGSVVVSSIAPGASTLLTLGSYSFPITANGLNNISVGVLPDQNTSNNIATATTSINCNTWGSGPSVVSFSNSVGFNTGSGIIFSKFNVPTTATLTAAKVAISSGASNTGNTVYAVLANATGSTIATSNTVVLTAGMNGTYQSFTFAPQTITSGIDYHVGLAQTSNTVGYFPIASFSTTNLPANLYATASLTNNAATVLTTNLGFLGIQAQFAGSCTVTAIGENATLNNNIVAYPNPAVNGKITIANLEGSNTITVYNMLGSVISTQMSSNSSVLVDLSNQAIGNYFVKITDSNSNSKTVKVINQ